jgi:hypothetical protein
MRSSEVLRELKTELERIERCDEVLTLLLYHHRSQAKPHTPPVTKAWHLTIVDKIEGVLSRKERP